VGLAACLTERAAVQGLHLGASQASVLTALDALWDGTHDGLYLHGPAGRGKTWLLDGVAACHPGARRYHWTQFFTALDTEVGRRLHAHDRLPRSIDAVVGDSSLLCFDELEVRDPDDAGLVEHLLIQLGSRGTPIVFTSNQAPSDLLADSRYSHWAAGLIRRLRERFVICQVDDGLDYRTLGSESRFASGRVYRAPQPEGLAPSGLNSGGRLLPVSIDQAGTLWADFLDLLSSPTGRQDYLAMCAATMTVGLFGVPAMASVEADTRQRFVTLVDVAYDTDTQLLLALTDEVDWSLPPERTVSRLAVLQR
jgi:cell division protein ZapE